MGGDKTQYTNQKSHFVRAFDIRTTIAVTMKAEFHLLAEEHDGTKIGGTAVRSDPVLALPVCLVL
jgi:hypothetical protein